MPIFPQISCASAAAVPDPARATIFRMTIPGHATPIAAIAARNNHQFPKFGFLIDFSIEATRPHIQRSTCHQAPNGNGIQLPSYETSFSAQLTARSHHTFHEHEDSPAQIRRQFFHFSHSSFVIRRFQGDKFQKSVVGVRPRTLLCPAPRSTHPSECDGRVQ